jgi:putative transposase
MMLAVLASLLKSRAALQLENVALRHQMGVFQRSAKKRLWLNRSDRLLWIWLSRVWTEWRSALVMVKLETVIA